MSLHSGDQIHPETPLAMGPDTTAQGLPPLAAILPYRKVKVPDVSSSALQTEDIPDAAIKLPEIPGAAIIYLPADSNVKMVQPLRLLLFCYFRALMWQLESLFNSFLHPLSPGRTPRWYGSIICGDAAEIRGVTVKKQRILLSWALLITFLSLCCSLTCWVFHPVCIFIFYKTNSVQEQPVSVDLNVSSGRAWLKLISVYPKSKEQFAFSPQLYTTRQTN